MNRPSEFCLQDLKNFFTSHDPKKHFESLTTRSGKLSISSKSKTSQFNQPHFNDLLSRYIKEEYNSPDYPEKISRDGSHFVQFLEIGKALDLDIESIYTALRLLFNKLKLCEVVDVPVVIQITDAFNSFLPEYFYEEEAPLCTDILIKETERIILAKFTDQLQLFQQTPDTFIQELSLEIGQIFQKEVEYQEQARAIYEKQERLRFMVQQILEILLNKMMWDPFMYEDVIPTFIELGNNILKLATQPTPIIKHMDDLENLVTSFNGALCKFLNMYNSTLPPEFFDELMSSLEGNVFFFLEINMQDKGVMHHTKVLHQSIESARIVSLYHQGQNPLPTEQDDENSEPEDRDNENTELS